MQAVSPYHTFADACRSLGREQADAIAMDFLGRRTRYGELDHMSEQVAHALLREGLTAGERIAYRGRNSDDFFLLAFGAAKAGIVIVPINWRLSGEEARFIVAHSCARMLFAEPDLAIEVGDDIRTVRTGGTPGPCEFREWWSDCPADPVAHRCAAADIAVQLYTSGTTGRPKGAMLSSAAFCEAQRLRQQGGLAWDLWDREDATLAAMPVGHIGGMRLAMTTLIAGARLVIVPQFDAGAVLDYIERDGITKLYIVPTALDMALSDPRAATADYSRLRYILYGAAPMPLALLQKAQRMMRCGFVQTYGMTETCGPVATLEPEDHDPTNAQKIASVGRAAPGVELAIAGPDGAHVAPGERGEILVRSPSNMAGYWRDPEATAATVDADGWLRSGDVGWLDPAGYLYLCDRLKDVIISGGENVYPLEVEQALSAHPAVLEAAAFGTPDERWGEAVSAAVVLRPGFSANQAELQAFARRAIAGFKVPKTIRFVESLPRNGAGKVLRRTLRAG